MSSVVYCIHHKEGCKWSDELRKLKVSFDQNHNETVNCFARLVYSLIYFQICESTYVSALFHNKKQHWIIRFGQVFVVQILVTI